MITRKSKFRSQGTTVYRDSKFSLASLKGIILVNNLIFFSESSFSRLESLSLKQEQDKVEKIERWEIWIIRIRNLQYQCQEKAAALKSAGEPQNKKDVEEQMILAKVSHCLSRNVRVNQDHTCRDCLIGLRAAPACMVLKRSDFKVVCIRLKPQTKQVDAVDFCLLALLKAFNIPQLFQRKRKKNLRFL